MARYTRRRARRARTSRKKSRKTRRSRGPRRIRVRRTLNTHSYVRAQEETLYNIWNPITASAEVNVDNNPIFERPVATNVGTSQPYAGNVNLVSDSQFQLIKTDGYGDFEALYDYYKINKVVMTFEYKCSAQGAGTASTSQTSLMSSILYFQDADDGINANFNEWKQRAATARKHNLRSPLTVTINRPTVLMGSLIESTTGTPVLKRSPWLDLAYPNVNHFGLKFLIQDWPLWSGSNAQEDVVQACLRVTVKYYITCKNVR